ncbi:unnamed protein product [Dovyalis caffra]|uniref:Uncharacterized protein n=1 Tax=Dovyalis caffra TaxID=77055 RepID=A0AAV1SQL4_9ROSI|nr:unnamed protein product [Dovyalis caffra]
MQDVGFEMKSNAFLLLIERQVKRKRSAFVMSVKMRMMGWRERTKGEGNSVNFGGCPPHLEVLPIVVLNQVGEKSILSK